MKERKKTFVGSSLVGMLLLLPPFSHAAQSVHPPLTDLQIRTRIEQALVDEGIVGVEASVVAGEIRLTGEVPNAWQRDEATHLAELVRDVRSVVSTVTVVPSQTDQELERTARQSVNGSVFYSIFDAVDLTTKDGVVTLTGWVTLPYKSRNIAEAVARVPGVQGVENRIRVLPDSSADDQIRREIATRLYRHPAFWDMGIQVNPPIHILVNEGRVTLEGQVPTQVDRREAERIARSVLGTASVEDQLVVTS